MRANHTKGHQDSDRLRLIAHRVVLGVATLTLAAIVMVSCSSAPSTPAEEFGTRNKAAEFAKLGDTYMAQGNYDLAAGYYGDSLQANSSVDNLEGVANSHASIGRAYISMGQDEAARLEFESALWYATTGKSASAQAMAKIGLGEILHRAGKSEEALALFEEAVTLLAKNDKLLAIALHDRGAAKAALGKPEEAILDLDQSAKINQKLRRWSELASDRYVMAAILKEKGKIEEALAMMLLALEADKKAENGRGAAKDLSAAAKLATRLGRGQEAWGYWLRCFDTSLALNDAALVRSSLEALISLAGELGKDADGKRYVALLAKLDAAEAKASAPSSTP